MTTAIKSCTRVLSFKMANAKEKLKYILSVPEWICNISSDCGESFYNIHELPDKNHVFFKDCSIDPRKL